MNLAWDSVNRRNVSEFGRAFYVPRIPNWEKAYGRYTVVGISIFMFQNYAFEMSENLTWKHETFIQISTSPRTTDPVNLHKVALALLQFMGNLGLACVGLYCLGHRRTHRRLHYVLPPIKKWRPFCSKHLQRQIMYVNNDWIYKRNWLAPSPPAICI